MQIPEILVGDTKAVTAACRKHLAQFDRGGSWIEAGAMIDVERAAGLILLDGPSPNLRGSNVRLYGPFWELQEELAEKSAVAGHTVEPTTTRCFDEALIRPWSVLGLLSQACYRWLKDPQRAERFLEAIIAYWAELDAVGPRYAAGGQSGRALWEIPHLLKFVLARRGVPQARLVAPLPAGGIAALLPARD